MCTVQSNTLAILNNVNISVWSSYAFSYIYITYKNKYLYLLFKQTQDRTKGHAWLWHICFHICWHNSVFIIETIVNEWNNAWKKFPEVCICLEKPNTTLQWHNCRSGWGTGSGVRCIFFSNKLLSYIFNYDEFQVDWPIK